MAKCRWSARSSSVFPDEAPTSVGSAGASNCPATSEHSFSSSVSRWRSSCLSSLCWARSAETFKKSRSKTLLMLQIHAAFQAHFRTFLIFAWYSSEIRSVKVFCLSQFVRHEPLAFVETEQICWPPQNGKLRLFFFCFDSTFARPSIRFHGTLISNLLNSIVCSSKQGGASLKLCAILSRHTAWIWKTAHWKGGKKLTVDRKTHSHTTTRLVSVVKQNIALQIKSYVWSIVCSLIYCCKCKDNSEQ